MIGAARRVAIALALAVSAIACAQIQTSGSMDQYVDNVAITAQVETAILNDPTLKMIQIEVETHNGTVQLSGFVDTPEMIVRAGALARQVSGVLAVQNNLMVK